MNEIVTAGRSLSSLLFGKTRLAILSLLYGQAGESFYLRQIVRLSGAGLGPVQRELGKLVEAQIVRRMVQGRHVRYQANSDSPIFRDLRSLLVKISHRDTVGPHSMRTRSLSTQIPVKVPRKRLNAFCVKHHISKLSYFGSVLRPDFSPTSDVDVLVEFEPGQKPSYFGLYDMEEELTGLFGGRKADIRTAEDISQFFRHRVIAEAKVQYVATR